MEQVSDILARNSPQFNTVAADCFVSDALSKMNSENVDYLIVLGDEGFLGIITDHDITNKVLYANHPLDAITVKSFMNQCLPVATLENSIEYCLQLMDRYNVRHVAVYDQFMFKGIVSLQDLMKEMLSKRKDIFDDVAQENEYDFNY